MTREVMLGALMLIHGYIDSKIKVIGIGDIDGTLRALSKAMELAICELLDREPRLLTEEDFKDNPDVDAAGFLPCWVECNEEEKAKAVELGVIEPGETVDGWTEINVESMPGHKDYNPNVRYWTGRPSQLQGEATPWQAPSTSDSAPNG